MGRGKAKVPITIEENLLQRLDALVAANSFASRSGAIEEAGEEKPRRLESSRLARECAKLDQILEQQLADEGLTGDLDQRPEW
jgi:Arc/MetJ-type ribon-helix-helix transcriptional regulator